MCGICGVWDEGGREHAREVGAMVGAMSHRGPDDRGQVQESRAALGMTRLAIIDTSAAGHQPMQTPDGLITVVYNGEMYNFAEERSTLERRGVEFRSTSDTEVVLRMYEHYGDDFLLRMRGMFAVAVYDRRGGAGRERLVVARDQMGIKPLLYARASGRLVFASELKALLASGLVEAEVDPVALRLLLTYGSVHQPRTILRGVAALPPAHRLVVEAGRDARVERYWSLGVDRRPELRELPYEELVGEVSKVLDESVRLQMVADVPLGAFLSGGVDSSLLVALMARHTGGQRVKTFSVGFEDEHRGIDETDDAERTARFIGTDHTRVLVNGRDVRERIEHIARGLDQPTVDGVNSYFVSLAARSRVTVAISGTGGDELFAGYPWFGQMVLDEMRRRSESSWRAAAKSILASLARRPVFDPLLEGRGGARLDRVRSSAGFVTRYASTYQIFGTDGATRLLAPALRRAAQAGRSPHYDLGAEDELPEGSVLERVSAMCLRGYTASQLLRDIDAASMSHSLEVRVPYLDPVVADAALSLPDAAKMGAPPDPGAPEPRGYREAGTKLILLDVAERLLPEGFDLPPKRGFGMPFEAWMRGPLRDVLTDTLSERSTSARGLLDARQVERVRDEFLAGALPWYQPWLLMMLELWSRELLDRQQDAHEGANCTAARGVERSRDAAQAAG
ncbi:MAG TPA: asparagine synthase (glutamine-hydrolyzing) [Pyrinomonadaceae bacterium]|nr:asparagine synthase (glutamine-hydrolyzing) [Pyrinomonadaceae bacterium]